MNLNFSLEDINIEITSDETGDPVEEQMADEAAQEEVEEASEEVEAVAKFGMQLVDIYQNLTFIKKHVQMFGVTKQMLHLVNANGQLSSAIGLTLPHYESDDEAEDITMDDVPEAEVVVEGLGEAVTKAMDAIKKFFKTMWEKIKVFFKNIFVLSSRLKKNITALKSRLSGKVDEEKFKDMKATAISFKDFEEALTVIDVAITAIDAGSKNISEEGKLNINNINPALALCGKRIAQDQGKYEMKSEKAPEYTEQNLATAGWTAANINKSIPKLMGRAQDVSNNKAIEKILKEAEAKALKKYESFNAEELNKMKKIIVSNTSLLVSSFNALVSLDIKLIKLFITMGNKIPMQSTKK